MIQTNLRAPVELKEHLKKEAERQGISLNQLIVSILYHHQSGLAHVPSRIDTHV